MKKSAKAVAFLVFLVSASGVFAQDKIPTEAYSGVAIGTGGGVGGFVDHTVRRLEAHTLNQQQVAGTAVDGRLMVGRTQQHGCGCASKVGQDEGCREH